MWQASASTFEEILRIIRVGSVFLLTAFFACLKVLNFELELSRLVMILSHLIAVFSAFLRSLQYAGALRISRSERVSYTKKCIRLALCYAGFGTPWSLKEAWKAGEAAFLSCAYDVATDWRHFDEEARGAFERILINLSRVELRILAMALYEKDAKNQLSEDGLERGAIALEFILKTMECQQERAAKWGDLIKLGELLQIVDDVLDYEDDTAAGDQNCLSTANRVGYLKQLCHALSRENSQRLFGSRSVLVFAIAQARKKATVLLSSLQ